MVRVRVVATPLQESITTSFGDEEQTFPPNLPPKRCPVRTGSALLQRLHCNAAQALWGSISGRLGSKLRLPIPQNGTRGSIGRRHLRLHFRIGVGVDQAQLTYLYR